MRRIIKKYAVLSLCLIAVISTAAITIVRAESAYGDWEQFESINYSIMQRHAHPRQLMKVPICRQDKVYYSAVACVQSLLRYESYHFDIRQDNLAKALNVTEDRDVTPQKIVSYLNAVRLNGTSEQWFTAEKKTSMTVDNLINELKVGHPVLLDIQAWDYDENEEYTMDLDYSNEWGCGHWVLAIGYNKSSIFFMDPSTNGNYTYIPKDKLVARWHDYGTDDNGQRYDCIQLGIIVRLKGTPDGETYNDAFYGLM